MSRTAARSRGGPDSEGCGSAGGRRRGRFAESLRRTARGPELRRNLVYYEIVEVVRRGLLTVARASPSSLVPAPTSFATPVYNGLVRLIARNSRVYATAATLIIRVHFNVNKLLNPRRRPSSARSRPAAAPDVTYSLILNIAELKNVPNLQPRSPLVAAAAAARPPGRRAPFPAAVSNS